MSDQLEKWILEDAADERRIWEEGRAVGKAEAAAEIERLQHRIDTLEGMLGEMNVAVPE